MLAVLANFHLVLKCSSTGHKTEKFYYLSLKEKGIFPVVWNVM